MLFILMRLQHDRQLIAAPKDAWNKLFLISETVEIINLCVIG